MTTFHGSPNVLDVGGKHYRIHDLSVLEADGIDLARLPVSIKILVENLLRHEDGENVRREDIVALAHWDGADEDGEIAFHPARIIMPDSSGIPLLADLTAMREWVASRGGDPTSVNPLLPLDMIVDHSATVEYWGTADAAVRNRDAEYAANAERYRFLKWAAGAYDRFTLFPPGSGIIHQINIEHLARPIRAEQTQEGLCAFPDTLVGLDSHTPMVNGLGVLGWGVGGIEAASAMLGEAIALPLLPVIGCRLTGAVRPGVNSTDVVLTVTQQLRSYGVVGALVEFTGPGLANLPVADRCTIANMAAEYGATMGFFPIDRLTIDYLRATGRDEADIALAEAYARRQSMWGSSEAIVFNGMVEIDLSSVETSVAGPKKPQQRNRLADVPRSFRDAFPRAALPAEPLNADRPIGNGDVAIAAIASCTNTSNPALLMAAGLLARKALARGLKVRPWIKTSLSPGSPVAERYLEAADLQASLDALGFNIVGFGCMTCAGQSGPLQADMAEAIATDGLSVAAVLSSNRNFEARVHQSIAAAYLAAPPLVIAYALAGTVLIDFETEPLGHDAAGHPVFLADIWPQPEEIEAAVRAFVRPELFNSTYAALSGGDEGWQRIIASLGSGYEWEEDSTYLRRPPYFDSLDEAAPEALVDIVGARPLLVVGDGVTTDHISPAGAIVASSAAGRYLQGLGVAPEEMHSHLVRRVNHDVMVRATFANPQLVNFLCPDEKGGVTRHFPSGELMPVHEAAARYRQSREAMVVVAGREYGMGSSRDWAAKGPHLLGVGAVIAESFERIHRSNLVGMGILPLQLVEVTRESLTLDGSELFDIPASAITTPNQLLTCRLVRSNTAVEHFSVRCRIQTAKELDWLRHGGVLQFVGRRLAARSAGLAGRAADREVRAALLS